MRFSRAWPSRRRSTRSPSWASRIPWARSRLPISSASTRASRSWRCCTRASGIPSTHRARCFASTCRRAASAGKPGEAFTHIEVQFTRLGEFCQMARGYKEDPSSFQPSTHARGNSANPMRILLVDDEPALRELLRATFEGADVTVDEAGSGVEAELRVRRRRPDVIVLDLRMPEMDGVELCRRLKSDEATRDIPIVLLTGAESEEARRAQRAGATALVRKPFSPLELLSVVQRVSGRKPLPHTPPKRAGRRDQELVLYARDLRHLLEIERGQRELLEQSYLATVTSLASALESRDTRTGAHSQRVKRYAVELLDLVDP